MCGRSLCEIKQLLRFYLPSMLTCAVSCPYQFFWKILQIFVWSSYPFGVRYNTLVACKLSNFHAFHIFRKTVKKINGSKNVSWEISWLVITQSKFMILFLTRYFISDKKDSSIVLNTTPKPYLATFWAKCEKLCWMVWLDQTYSNKSFILLCKFNWFS